MVWESVQRDTNECEVSVFAHPVIDENELALYVDILTT